MFSLRKQFSYKSSDFVWFEWHQAVDNKLIPNFMLYNILAYTLSITILRT